jgi:hypothetical protein
MLCGVRGHVSFEATLPNSARRDVCMLHREQHLCNDGMDAFTHGAVVEAPMNAYRVPHATIVGPRQYLTKVSKKNPDPIPLPRIMNHNTYRGADTLGRYLRSHRYGGR